MSYKKPLCPCGSPLRLVERKELRKEYQITQNGKEGRIKGHDEVDFFKSYLNCPKCDKTFYYDEDGEGRIVIGDLKSHADIT